MLIFRKLLLGYQDIPKNSSTTTLVWLFECLYSHSVSDEAKAPRQVPPHIHRYFWRGQCPDCEQLDNAAFRADISHDLLTFAITRDPIKRFLSMYSNRVKHFDELSSNSPAAPRLREQSLRPSPDVNQLAEQLEQYLSCDKNIHHHTRPMSDFLGDDLSIFTHFADVSELGSLIAHIQVHWRKHGLIELAEGTPQPQRLQTGGEKLGLEVLTPKAFDHLLEYYAVDYERIPTIDRRKIEQEYVTARTTADHFSASTTSIGPTYGTKLIRKDDKCPIVDLLWIDKIPPNLSSTEKLAISGALVLRPTFEREDWELVAVDRQGEHRVPWHFESPNMAKQFPDRKKASSARFRIGNLTLSMSEPVRLYLQSSKKDRWHLLSIKAER